jgi:cytochrome c553
MNERASKAMFSRRTHLFPETYSDVPEYGALMPTLFSGSIFTRARSRNRAGADSGAAVTPEEELTSCGRCHFVTHNNAQSPNDRS